MRLDNLTASSFVCCAPGIREEQLKKIDLLPQMAGKVILMKEMAPIFSGGEEELKKTFGAFASILDGQGYGRASGTHGMRSYYGRNVFSIIGAVSTKVLSDKVMEAIGAVGPRFCFFEMPIRDLSDWKSPGKRREALEDEFTLLVHEFLNEFCERHPVDSVALDEFELGSDEKAHLEELAKLMVKLRSEFIYERELDGKATIIQTVEESPERAFQYLHQLVCGSALIRGEKTVRYEDLELALEIAIGSAQTPRRKAARVFFKSTEALSASEFSRRSSQSDDTARRWITRIEQLGVVEKVNLDGTGTWALTAPYRDLARIFRDRAGFRLNQ